MSLHTDMLTPIDHNITNPCFCHRHTDVIPATEQDKNCETILRFQLDKQTFIPKHHTAFLAVRTRSSLTPSDSVPETGPNITETANPDNPNTDDTSTGNETENNDENSPVILATQELNIDTSQNNPIENTENEQNPTSTFSNPLQRLTDAITDILTPKSTSAENIKNNLPTETNTTKALPSTPPPIPDPPQIPPPQTRNRPATHPTSYIRQSTRPSLTKTPIAMTTKTIHPKFQLHLPTTNSLHLLELIPVTLPSKI